MRNVGLELVQQARPFFCGRGTKSYTTALRLHDIYNCPQRQRTILFACE